MPRVHNRVQSTRKPARGGRMKLYKGRKKAQFRKAGKLTINQNLSHRVTAEVKKQMRGLFQSGEVRSLGEAKEVPEQANKAMRQRGVRGFLVRVGSPIDVIVTSAIDDTQDQEAQFASVDYRVPEDSLTISGKRNVQLDQTEQGGSEGLSEELTDEELLSLPDPVALEPDAVMKSIEEIADEFSIDRTTVSRRISSDKILGFKGLKNKILIPYTQFVNGVVVRGVRETLEVFNGDHAAAWAFLSSASFYGDQLERPIDRLVASAGKAAAKATVAQVIARAKADYEGDHL